MAYILPQNIDKIIFEELGGFYQKGTNVDININNSEEDNKRYLGTYFPRSFTEAYTIMLEIYSHYLVKMSVNKKSRIDILDIGTGTGGNILGMMEFFRSIGWNSEKITFYTLEGNSNAIEIQRRIFDSYNEKYSTRFTLQSSLIRFATAASINSQLENFLSQKNIRFDFITSFKFLSEFYNMDYIQAKGIYTSVIKTLQDFLKPQSFLILFDLVSGNMDRKRPRPFTTQIMSDELNEYAKLPSALLKSVLPVCCGKWGDTCKRKMCYIERQFNVQHSRNANDLSKGCYRVMTDIGFANQIIASQPSGNKYQMSQNTYQPRACFRAELYQVVLGVKQEPILNAFKFQ